MTEPPAPTARPARWLPFVASLVFAVAHTQPPLYYSNQNQYFLHGLADAGYGDLSRDWLANTADPTPVFSLGVKLAYQFCGTWPFHAAFLAMLVVYFLSLWRVAAALPFFPRAVAGQLVFAAVLTVVHAGIVRAASVAAVGVDYPWYFQAGVANQYLLGAGLQPSVFGVFLLTALAAFVSRRPVLAGGCAAFACVMHSTYLLPAGLLVVGMMAGAWQGDRKQALVLGATALVGVLPVIAYTLAVFAPTDGERFAEAQRVIAWVRIPHHTDVNRWLDVVAGLQLLWLLAGLIAFRRTALFVPLLVAAAIGFALSLLQVATGDATVALLFPWRISAVLVPVATAAAIAALVRLAQGENVAFLVMVVALLVGAAALLGTGAVYLRSLGYQETKAEADLIAFATPNRQPGDVYLLPSGFPKPPSSRGSASSSFVPIRKSDTPAIFELQRFRLGTGAAVYVDFKSIPYRDDEVLEWQRRVTNVARWYTMPDWDTSGIMNEVVAEGLTHVVVPSDVRVDSSRLMPMWAIPGYRVYRVMRE
jgi:hypothetical protein